LRQLLAIFGLVGICLAGITTSAEAALDLTGWSWQRSIDVRTSPGFVRLVMTPEIFNESQRSLGDLRVTDESNRLVPHVLHWGRVKETRSIEERPARLLNAAFVPGKYATVTADFGERTEKNHIRVGLSGQNYRRRALLEGSNEGQPWEVMAEDVWLFDVTLPGQNFKVDTIPFPTNNFRYLRLTVYNMADDPRRIAIETVRSAFLRTEMEKELAAVPVKQMAVSQDDKNIQTLLDLDVGFRNLPVVSLQFEISTPYFYRGYELVGRNEAREKVPRKTEMRWETMEQDVPWMSVQRGVLYRIQHKQKISESIKVEGNQILYRHLQLRIFNGDNPPLKLDGVSVYWRETSLVFHAEAGQRYRLIGGNPKVTEANYDLSRSVQGIDDLKPPAVSLGPVTAIPRKEQLPPWTERHSTLLWIILVLAVGTMLILIVRNLRKLPPPNKTS
jgi:hypothetical protein